MTQDMHASKETVKAVQSGWDSDKWETEKDNQSVIRDRRESP